MKKGRTSWNENRTAQHIRNIVQVQSKHKEREIRKRSRSIFTRWPTMIELLPIHTCGKRTQMHSREWKFVYSLRWRLRLHFHLRWGGSKWLESTRDIWIWCVQAASVCFTKKDFVPKRLWNCNCGRITETRKRAKHHFARAVTSKFSLHKSILCYFIQAEETELFCYRH